jgi:hypothetical protein
MTFDQPSAERKDRLLLSLFFFLSSLPLSQVAFRAWHGGELDGHLGRS